MVFIDIIKKRDIRSIFPQPTIKGNIKHSGTFIHPKIIQHSTEYIYFFCFHFNQIFNNTNYLGNY